MGGSAEELAALIPSAKAFTIEGRDHMKSVGDRTYKDAVLRFLAQVEPESRLMDPRLARLSGRIREKKRPWQAVLLRSGETTIAGLSFRSWDCEPPGPSKISGLTRTPCNDAQQTRRELRRNLYASPGTVTLRGELPTQPYTLPDRLAPHFQSTFSLPRIYVRSMSIFPPLPESCGKNRP